VFPTAPPQTGHEVLPHPAFHRTFLPLPFRAGSSSWFRTVACLRSGEPKRAISSGPVPRAWSGCQAFPHRKLCCLPVACGTMPGSDSLRGLLRAPREGLSSSWSDYAYVPSPIHRRVLGGCFSKVFPTSMAFAHVAQARLPLVPYGCPRGLTSRCGSVRLMLRTVRLLDPLPGPLSAGFDARISPNAAAQLRGGLVPTSTGLSPASLTRLIWTHATLS
jgi:hypothetical protein